MSRRRVDGVRRWLSRTGGPADAPLRAALQAAGITSWVMPAGTREVTWTDAGAARLGPDRVGPEPIEAYLDRVHPAEQDGLRAALDQCLAAGAAVSHEHRLLCPDGVVRWVHLAAGPEWAAGAVRAIHAVVFDVTDRHRAADAVRIVAEDATKTTGDAYFVSLVGYLCHALRVDHAFIGAVTDHGTIRTLARFSRGEPLDNIEYALPGTPCATALGDRRCYFPSGVAARFPDDPGLAALGVDCYMGVPLRDSSGATIGLLSIMHGEPLGDHDLSASTLAIVSARAGAELQRVRTTEALARQTRLLQSILTSIGDGVAVFDAEGRIGLVNPAGRALLHLPESPPGGGAEADLSAAPAAEAPEFAPVARALGGEPVHNAEVVVRRTGEGADAWLSVTASPLAEGGERGAVAVFRDVSEQRRAAEALRQSEERYRLLFEQSQALTLIIDATGTLLDVNDAAAASFGYLPSEVVGRSVFDFVAPDSLDEARRSIVRAFTNTAPSSVDIDVLMAGGERRSLLATARRGDFFSRDGRKGVLVSALDITERRRAEAESARLEEQVRQGQKMEAVGQLAGGVAHDFNNLLQAMHGYLHLALEHVEPAHPAYRRLVEVARAADRATELTRRLLAFSRRQTLEKRHFDPRRVVAEAANLLRRVIGGHIELRLDIDGGPSTILADAGQIEQVLMNLCVNARDAMPLGGVIRVQVDDWDVRDRRDVPEGAYVRLRVSDTGAGIPDHIRPRIFEPFFTTKNVGEGTGLGLATVYAIVTGLGGAIDVDSEPGAGTSFTVLLPRSHGTGDADDLADATAAPPGGAETLLVAEDEDLVRDLLVDMLEGSGYRVLVARDGAEAVELFGRHRSHIAMAVLDIVMPRLNGHQVAEQIRAMSPGLPVLFASGYGFESAGAAEVVVAKPYTRAELLRRVRALLDRR